MKKLSCRDVEGRGCHTGRADGTVAANSVSAPWLCGALRESGAEHRRKGREQRTSERRSELSLGLQEEIWSESQEAVRALLPVSECHGKEKVVLLEL